jgi:hypothetical protein
MEHPDYPRSKTSPLQDWINRPEVRELLFEDLTKYIPKDKLDNTEQTIGTIGVPDDERSDWPFGEREYMEFFFSTNCGCCNMLFLGPNHALNCWTHTSRSAKDKWNDQHPAK